MGYTIYRQIWNIDRKPENGGARVASVPVQAGAVSPDAVSPDANVVLDEQVRASGRRSIDLATRPLFRHVDPELLKRPTYAALRQLLDNYVVNYRAIEVSTPREEAEERDFVGKVVQTEVMQAAYDYIRAQLRPGLTIDAFRDEVLAMWFTHTPTTTTVGRRTIVQASNTCLLVKASIGRAVA